MARRAIVVIHGVGSQKKGQTLEDICEPFVRFLNRFVAKGNPTAIGLDVDLRPDDGPAQAAIRFTVDGEAEEWLITEAWWAERFHPSPSDPVLR